jgi:hypothetical protein
MIKLLFSLFRRPPSKSEIAIQFENYHLKDKLFIVIFKFKMNFINRTFDYFKQNLYVGTDDYEMFNKLSRLEKVNVELAMPYFVDAYEYWSFLSLVKLKKNYSLSYEIKNFQLNHPSISGLLLASKFLYQPGSDDDDDLSGYIKIIGENSMDVQYLFLQDIFEVLFQDRNIYRSEIEDIILKDKIRNENLAIEFKKMYDKGIRINVAPPENRFLKTLDNLIPSILHQ